jgi:hypothetical protein
MDFIYLRDLVTKDRVTHHTEQPPATSHVSSSAHVNTSHAVAGAQALVAWTLSRAFPGTTVSMVAEEDSADLRAPEGKAMLERITQLVNTVLASDVKGSPQITEQDLIDLIGGYTP